MINGSIVLFKSRPEVIQKVISQFLESSFSNLIYLIDNSPTDSLSYLSKQSSRIKYIHSKSNVGYGAGHNIAIKKSIKKNINFHLIINPDIEMDTEDIDHLFNYMIKNKNVGLVMPKILNTDGSIQYLCKKLPSPINLILRFFTPSNFMKKSKEKFYLKSTGYNKIMNIPYLSGCFMFLNVEAIKKVGMFDERFFMYPEDIDLTRRIHTKFKTIFYPEVSVVHHHEKASSKSIKMAFIHILNIIRYFNKWGWIFDKQRRLFNARLKIYE